MAGDAFSRFKTQVLIFFSVKVRKHFDTSTAAGKTRLLYFVGIMALLLFAAVTFSDGGMDGDLVTANEGGAFGMATAGGALGGFDDDDDDENSGGGGGEMEDDGGDDDGGDGGDDDGGGYDADGDEDEGDNEGAGRGGGNDDEAEAASLRAEQQARQAEMKAGFTDFFQGFKQETEVRTFLQSYADKYREVGIFSTQSIGQTYEKRSVDAYVLGKGDRHVVILGSEHGSEWSVPMYLTYIVSRFTMLYGINDDVTSVLDNLKLHVIPVPNPDGMAYTSKSKSHDARNYIKNRAPIRRHSTSKGVDFRDDWGSFSQLETKAVREYVTSLKGGGLEAFVAVQCCMGLVTRPINTTCIKGRALEEQAQVAQRIADKMGSTKTYSAVIQTKPSKHSKSHLDDVAMSWAQNKLGLSLSYTLSVAKPLPPAGKKVKKSSKSSDKKAVVVPEEDIVSDSKDVAQGVVALAKHLVGEFRRPSSFCDGGDGDAAGGAPADSQSAGDGEDEEIEEEEEVDEDEDQVDPDADDGEGDEDVEDEEGGPFGRASRDHDDDDGEEGIDADDDDADDGDAGVESDEDDAEGDDDGAEGLVESDDDEAADSDASLRGFQAGEDMELSEKDRRDYEMSKRFAHTEKKSSKSSSSSFGSHRNPEVSFADAADDVAKALRYARGGVSQARSQNDDEHFLYFAYGPDMMFDVLYVSGITSAIKVATARLDGYVMDYTYYSKRKWRSGVADLIPSPRGETRGVVYRVDRSQREILDKHNLASEDTSALRPVKVKVTDSSGNELTCITYKVRALTARDDNLHPFKRFKPSRQYRNCVIKGAKQQGFPEDYIEQRLRSIPAMLTDKTGTTSTHRNHAIGSICDHSTTAA